MGAVLEIVKRFKFEIICGAVAVVAVALIVLGLGAMGSVNDELQAGAAIRDQIANMAQSPDPVNDATLAMARRRIDQIQKGYNDTLTFASKNNAYEPLLEDAFPKAEPRRAIDFQKAYQAEVRNWLTILKAGDVPTRDEIRAERDRLEAELGESPGRSRGGGPDESRGSQSKSSLDEDAEVRASINKARSIRCYATPSSFSTSAISDEGGPMDRSLPPTPEQMWFAQIEVWIQRDIVDGIAAINDAEAQRLASDGQEAWVGNLPVKELVSIQLTPPPYYVGLAAVEGGAGAGEGAGGTGAGGPGGAGRQESKGPRVFPPNSAEGVFTKNRSNELFELVQFTARMVVDSRDLPAIIDGLCEGKFHTPLNVTYERTPPNLPPMTGRIYGDEPAVTVTIDFETVFFSELYLPIMPDEILARLNKQRPEPKKDGDA